PRQGSAGPRARAGRLGCRVRSDAGWPHQPAQLRRPSLSASGARRRPHGPRTHPHAPGSRHPDRDDRAHGAHRGRADPRRRPAGVLAYDREKGRFHVFAAKAIVLATGGIGRAFKITSNSWEGTGDGHALAYRAGAELIDMEFIQFHPTGMVWPPSVKGILVTE